MSTISTTFPVVHSVLDPQALQSEVAAHFALGAPDSCVLLRSWINEVYQLQIGGQPFILKVYRRGWRSADEVGYEVALMRHLAAKGLAVAPPIDRRDGNPVHVLAAPEGPRPALLFPLLAGRPPLPPSVAIYRNVGRAVAEMHQALDSFATTRPQRGLDDGYLLVTPLQWLRPVLANRRPEDWSFLTALGDAARRRLHTLRQTGALSWGPIHGDATLDNLLITADERIGIYDFDQSGPGWRAYELQGVFQYAWAIERPDFWAAVVEGYSAVQPLSPVDHTAMPCFVVMNKLWCMGFEAHVIAGNHGRWIVSDTYFDEALRFLRRWAAAHPELSDEISE